MNIFTFHIMPRYWTTAIIKLPVHKNAPWHKLIIKYGKETNKCMVMDYLNTYYTLSYLVTWLSRMLEYLPPTARGHMRTFTIPCIWWSGNAWSTVSFSVQPQASTREDIWACILAWVITAPETSHYIRLQDIFVT